jgi:hypothetical protein
MAGGRGDQTVEHVGVLDFIASTERFDDTLDVTAAFASVLDEVQGIRRVPHGDGGQQRIKRIPTLAVR